MRKDLLSLKVGMLAVAVLVAGTSFAQTVPKPSNIQLQWQENETTAFIHFTVNTFTDKEWGQGNEDPAIFNPIKLDARQWVKALKDAGFKVVIITAKHHDGFCLWPSKYTEHSVKNSPWRNGHGDIVKEVADACKKYGVKFGFYLSPWDRHEKTYGTPAYNDYYKNQLRELLTGYGEVAEVWFDGAKGANEKDMRYDFDGYWKLVKQLQPRAIIYSAVGPDVRWVGNEKGIAGETCWSTINTEGMYPGKADSKYLNTGDPDGNKWIPAETDVSIRPGWFYHESEDKQIKSPKALVNLYYQSVGRNSLLLLNVPPNRDGLFVQADIDTIKAFRRILDETFRHNLLNKKQYKAMTDGNMATYCSARVGSVLELKFKKTETFNRMALQENIADGQLISAATIEYWDNDQWKMLQKITTVGYKRLLKFNNITTDKVRITINGSKNNLPIELAEIGFYKASPSE